MGEGVHRGDRGGLRRLPVDETEWRSNQVDSRTSLGTYTAKEVLVACPRCTEKARVEPAGERPWDWSGRHATCSACGWVAEQFPTVRHLYDAGGSGPALSLWLRTNCGGHELWAVNEQHLDVLERIIDARHRTRARDEKWGWMNASMASRLPKWMLDAKHREVVLKAIDRLRSKLC